MREHIETIAKNIEAVAAGRDITVLGATKSVSPEVIDTAFDLGLRIFGENRVQELLAKYDKVSRPVEWHFIGRLQTNKVKYIIDKVSLIHSVDSEKLLAEINKQARKRDIVMPVLIEVNMGREIDKGGVFPEDVISLCDKTAMYDNIRLRGLMCVFPKEAAESLYMDARSLFETVARKYSDISVLSMGMSDDYIVAVRYGATLVRIGKRMFGTREER